MMYVICSKDWTDPDKFFVLSVCASKDTADKLMELLKVADERTEYFYKEVPAM